jgi:hypothetical protein
VLDKAGFGYKSSASKDGNMTGRFLPAALAAAFVLASGQTVAAFQYPVPGSDGDPDFCSSRHEPVMFCFTPPANTHCQPLQNEETPLYLGYRYSCNPTPEPARAKPAPEGAP